MALTTVVLDVNETLFSLDAVAAAFGEVGLDPDDLETWFSWVLRDGFAVAAMGDAVVFPDLARHHLRVLGDRADQVLDDAAIERVVDAFHEVEAHPDVDRGLRTLADAGLRLAAFTNGSASIARRFLERAGLDEVVDHALDVSDAGRWKPHPDAYRWVCDHLGSTPDTTAMLAVHPWDVAGAMGVGLLGAWLDRDHARWPAWLRPADVSAGSMVELASALAART